MNSDEGCGYGDVGAYDSGVQSMFTIENKSNNWTHYCTKIVTQQSVNTQ
jgi:hypothetical protein